MPELRRGARRRPELPDPPFLCAECRHGHMIVQKLQPWLLDREAWRDDRPDWFWQASCRSPKVTPWKFAVFAHPVVACDAFRSRELLTTEDRARKQAERAARRRRKQRKKRKKDRGRSRS